MPSVYQERQRRRQIDFHRLHRELFDDVPLGGQFLGKPREFVLQRGAANLLPAVRAAVVEYFARHQITWWGGSGPPGHLLSSQVACLNHLYPLRTDPAAVTAMLQALDPAVAEALPIPTDQGEPGYLQFEATGDGSHLNEGALRRGSQCTSLDVLAYARLHDGSRRLFGIEWKYTEHYGNEDKFRDTKPDGGQAKGEVRKRRYAGLLRESRQLLSTDWLDYGCEPFYQLLRQTLLLEQLVAHRDSERIQAESWRHVHVIPLKNLDLLGKSYLPRGQPLEQHWRALLRDPELYTVVDPADLLAPIAPQYADLLAFLAERYWD